MNQRTDEWFQARLGHVTASRVSDAIAGKDTATRRNYMVQLIAERLTNQQQESFTNAAMQWGTETEPLARAAYQAEHDLVEEVGFIKHPSIEWFGASPDGVVGEGLIEIKCPNTTTHLDWILGKKTPAKHQPQMMAQLAVTGKKWCDFVSFDPRLPEHLRLFVVRFQPTQEAITDLENKVRDFLNETQLAISKLEQK
jgi:putative phage-type endonuclease